MTSIPTPEQIAAAAAKAARAPRDGDFQDRGEAARQDAGIDGTAGDAQDIPHGFVRDDQTGACLICGLAESYRKHVIDGGHVQQGDPQPPTPPCPACGHPMGDHSVYRPPLRPRPTWCHACDTHCGHRAA